MSVNCKQTPAPQRQRSVAFAATVSSDEAKEMNKTLDGGIFHVPETGGTFQMIPVASADQIMLDQVNGILCAGCFTPHVNMKKCRCGFFYCSKECQLTTWSQHKLICIPGAAECTRKHAASQLKSKRKK
jgi:hypothetical protein